MLDKVKEFYSSMTPDELTKHLKSIGIKFKDNDKRGEIMEEYYVEMSFGFVVTAKVKAKSKEDAIIRAKLGIPESIDINVSNFASDYAYIENCGDIQFEQVNFVNRIVVDNN